MIGIPPATAASKNTGTFFAAASSKISFPCSARSALFAVITILPASIARRMNRSGNSIPPISSITIRIEGSSIKSSGRVTKSSSGASTLRGSARSFTAMRRTENATPVRSSINAPLRARFL